ncbi:hypothetical protein PHYBOEH_003298 [Phytophthora boehmeriae]|uniref:Uncharacterized protein n=1 Tax=Phytophthora boehmeriae TaxID=109152 RepID=A0A8T1WVR6_9STRA|nr:hypothetical protein PHYBOEH_003298 [Phytophthora boehmeriae]
MRPPHLLTTAALLLHGVSAFNETNCWKIDANYSMQEALEAYSGSACAVSVTIPELKASYAPHEDVALLWGVQIDEDSSNDLQVPIPPDSMPTLSADNLLQDVQILATYVRTCASPLECAPTLLNNDTYTAAQSGNFSSSDATYFESVETVSFAEAGNYTVAAVAVLGNAENSTLLYFFQTTREIVVKQIEVEKPEYDQPTTYCRVTEQDPLDDLLDASMLRASSDSCEIELAVEKTNVVQVGQPVDIVWTAALTRNTSKEVQLPSPLVAMDIANGSVVNSSHYTIVRSVVKLCERNMECNEYSSSTTVSSFEYAANFTTASTATSNASNVVIPSSGWYGGYAQITLAGKDQDSQRYDFVTYFEIFATTGDVAEQVQGQTYLNDGSESYCWEVVAAIDDDNVDASNVAFVGSGNSCPYAVSMSVNTTALTVDTSANVNWAVAQNINYLNTGHLTVTLSTVYDETTGKDVNIPVADIYYCSDTTCSPFSKNKTLLYSGNASSFEGAIGVHSFFSPVVTLPSEGTYALMAHVVIPNGDGMRFDVAAFVRMTVSSASTTAAAKHTSTSNVGLILGATAGCAAALGLAVLGIAIVRRRQQHKEAAADKERSYSIYGFSSRSHTNEVLTNSAHGSEESGLFMYVKAQISPMDAQRAGSLSYDPYSRRSFLDEASSYSFSLSEPDLAFPTPETSPTHLSTQPSPATP